MRKAKLNAQEWLVYNYIKEVTLGNDASVTQREIYEYMLTTEHPLTWNSSQNMHNDHCRKLHDIVEGINSCYGVDHFVIHHAYKYRVASEKEVEDLVVFYLNKGKAAWSLANIYRRKAKRNGQGKLLSNSLYPIVDGSKAKEFHEAFNSKGAAQDD